MYNRNAKLNLVNVDNIKLNEFDKFLKLLFTPAELENPKKWEKFIVHYEESLYEKNWAIALPFGRPGNDIVKFQINHFVMWNCIAHYEATEKPDYFITYNTGAKYRSYDTIENACFCCHWGITQQKKAGEDGIFCGDTTCPWCPIWECTENNDVLCEAFYGSQLQAYRDWIDGRRIKESALALAMAPWTDRRKEVK